MKPIPCTLPILCGLACSAWCAAAPVMRDAVGHEQLVQSYRRASAEDPMRRLPATQGADPSLANRPKDILSESDIICYNGMATLVPKRAIIGLPASMKDRLKFQPGSKLLGWADFFALNRGWITTVEVSRVQAEGNETMKPEITERIGRSANLVVATHLGGPISVLPPKVPAGNETAKAP